MFNSNLRKKLLNNKKIIITEYWERWHAVSPNLNCSVKLSKKIVNILVGVIFHTIICLPIGLFSMPMAVYCTPLSVWNSYPFLATMSFSCLNKMSILYCHQSISENRVSDRAMYYLNYSYYKINRFLKSIVSFAATQTRTPGECFSHHYIDIRSNWLLPIACEYRFP